MAICDGCPQFERYTAVDATADEDYGRYCNQERRIERIFQRRLNHPANQRPENRQRLLDLCETRLIALLTARMMIAEVVNQNEISDDCPTDGNECPRLQRLEAVVVGVDEFLNPWAE